MHNTVLGRFIQSIRTIHSFILILGIYRQSVTHTLLPRRNWYSLITSTFQRLSHQLKHTKPTKQALAQMNQSQSTCSSCPLQRSVQASAQQSLFSTGISVQCSTGIGNLQSKIEGGCKLEKHQQQVAVAVSLVGGGRGTGVVQELRRGGRGVGVGRGRGLRRGGWVLRRGAEALVRGAQSSVRAGAGAPARRAGAPVTGGAPAGPACSGAGSGGSLVRLLGTDWDRSLNAGLRWAELALWPARWKRRESRRWMQMDGLISMTAAIRRSG